MKNRSRLMGAVLALVGWSAPFGAAAQTPVECPNVKASLVDARVENVGDEQRCGLGVSLFGWGIGLFGPKCPDKKATYPAHQECKGERNIGTYCTKESDLNVSLEECDCVVGGLFGTGLALPACKCTPSSTDGGHIEDFETRDCPPEV